MEKDYRELYEKITNSDWFKKAYHNKSLGECPIVVEEPEESEDERIRKFLIDYFECIKSTLSDGTWKGFQIEDILGYLEKQKDAGKAIEAVERIDKYIDEHTANAHDMKDSNPDKKYYRGWDDALGKMAGILQDVYSGEKQKEQQKPAECTPDSVLQKIKRAIADCKKLSEHYKDTKENFYQYYGGKAEGLQLALTYFGNENELAEQKPITNVFGFKVGDKVRLKDGDGRTHIIKSFEEVEGLHGPNFYHVEFEDNSARDSIYPGEEYPNGYYTQMEKIEEEQKPADDKSFEEWLNDWYNEHHRDGYITMDERELKNWGREIRNMYQQKHAEWDKLQEEFRNINEAFEDGKKEVVAHPKKYGLCKSAEWSEEDETILECFLGWLQGSMGEITYSSWLKSLRERFNLQPKQEWNEADKKMLLSIINAFRNGTVSTIGQEHWLKSLPERFNPQPKQEWSEEDKEMLNDIVVFVSGYADKRVVSRWVEFLKSLRPQPKQEWSEEDIKKIRSEEYTKGFNDAAFGGKLKEWSTEDEDRIRQIERIAQQAGCTQKLQEEIHDWLKSLRPQKNISYDIKM